MKNYIKNTGRVSFLVLVHFCLLMNQTNLKAQNTLEVFKTTSGNSPVWKEFKDAPYYLYGHLSQEAYNLLDQRENLVKAIQTPEEWKNRQEEIRKKLIKSVGPFPEKTPLNHRITGTIQKEDHKIEHIIYESMPGYFVTASLFVPSGLGKKKAPAILYCSGHTDNGYRSSVYQFVILNLVKKGFIVFAFDPIGQGERIQYYDQITKKSKVGAPTREHSYPGTQMFLNGSSAAKYFIWDGIRAIDYLVSRKEVDSSRIGITGRSGGGTQSAYIAALDDRIYAAAPECWITKYRRLIQSIGTQDAEQNLPRLIYEGLDKPDYLIVRAPKPAMMITTTNDFFNIQGAMEAEKEISHIYNAYEKPGNFSRVEDFGIHTNTKKNREAMYAFFQKHLNNPGNSADEEVQLLSEEELQVTTTGQISTSLGSETMYSLNKKEAEKYATRLANSRSEPEEHLSAVVKSAMRLSRYIEPGEVESSVLTGKYEMEGYSLEKCFIQGEGDYVIPFVWYIPEMPVEKVLLYLHPNGKMADSISLEEMNWFAKRGFAVLAPDLIGTGETFPAEYRGDAYMEGISMNVWYTAVLVNKSIAGIRAGDVSRLVGLAKKRFTLKGVYALAKGEMSPVLLHAAVFNPSIQNIALVDPLSSYISVSMCQFYKVRYIYNVVPGAIQHYDLPDLGACIAPRSLLMVNITDGAGEMLDHIELQNEVSVIRKAYKMENAENGLDIRQGISGREIRDAYLKWMIK
jgi:cephalosporin-C deacetylase-like acetyl esterase